jgi:alkylation response protein AidB-like acyl-CoA dehydrogenase
MTDIEDVATFRLRAREWIAANLPPVAARTAGQGDADHGSSDDGSSDDGLAGSGRGHVDDAAWQRARGLQRLLFDAGFAGLCYPREYGGQGLTPEHQKAFTEETAGYEMPLLLNIPTFSIAGPVLLELGSEELKREHLPRVLSGEEVLVQFLSEPRGGSDLAGVTTRAVRDGDVFIVNGAKTWSSGAYAGDYATCLVRTDWDAPKHRGLTMLLLKIHQPGVTIRRIMQLDGNEEFCEEFLDDVEVPVSNVIGEVNGGWAVASRQLFHERNAVGGGSPYVSGGSLTGHGRPAPAAALAQLARQTGQAADPRARELVAESQVLSRVQEQLIGRVVAGMRSEQLPSTAGSIIRLFGGLSTVRRAEISVELAGSYAVVGPADEAAPAAADGAEGPEAAPAAGVQFLMRQAACLGGGSTEMARNIISERILGMPRELAADRDVPFSQVRQGRA